jgi:hypothetical protein
MSRRLDLGAQRVAFGLQPFQNAGGRLRVVVDRSNFQRLVATQMGPLGETLLESLDYRGQMFFDHRREGTQRFPSLVVDLEHPEAFVQVHVRFPGSG